MDKVKEIRQKIQHLKELPPLPAMAEKILSLSDETDIKELAETIEKDPCLSARILGLANAAYFGWPGGVRTIYDAIYKVLGLKIVRSIAIGLILGGLFKAEKCPRFSSDRYWFTSVATAMMAQSLYLHMTADLRRDLRDIYMDGLLHKLGLPVLVHLFPQEMNGIFSADDSNGEYSLNVKCREVIGINPCEAGAWLARRWHLPKDIVCVIENSGDFSYKKDFWAIVQLVGYCSRQAELLFKGDEMLNGLDQLNALGIDAAVLEKENQTVFCKIKGISEMALLLSGSESNNG